MRIKLWPLLGLLLAVTVPAFPQTKSVIDELVLANHILANEGVLDGYGHVSVRNPANPSHYFLAKAGAPSLVTAADITEYDLDSKPVTNASATGYTERFIHGEIYKARPDVIAVVHCHCSEVIPFANTSVPLQPMHHMGSFIGAGVPVFEIRDVSGVASNMLISSAALGRALAVSLGARPVALMRGHGSVAAAQSVRHVVFRAIYTEVNARIESDALRLGEPMFLNDGEAEAAMKTNDALVDRPWDLWQRRVTGK